MLLVKLTNVKKLCVYGSVVFITLLYRNNMFLSSFSRRKNKKEFIFRVNTAARSFLFFPIIRMRMREITPAHLWEYKTGISDFFAALLCVLRYLRLSQTTNNTLAFVAINISINRHYYCCYYYGTSLFFSYTTLSLSL